MEVATWMQKSSSERSQVPDQLSVCAAADFWCSIKRTLLFSVTTSIVPSCTVGHVLPAAVQVVPLPLLASV